ncbi:MAG: tetratricopeptide repeat protein [Paludibacteraceae bacterium]|nr:tetratricopeptide repeat protein [Paludibacteraceae bacterium]
MKQHVLVFYLLFCLISCSQHSKLWNTLLGVETYIIEHPDSALVVLQDIDADELSGDEERAKHALLLSMALDKNVIDKTDFEVLQPAIDYYKDNGSATDKLRMYYYQGRIYENQGNEAQAMTCFCEGIEQGGDSEDLLTKANLYFAQSRIYVLLLEWDKQINVLLKAADLYKTVGRQKSYYNCIAQILNAYSIKKDDEQVEKYIEIIKAESHLVDSSIIADFYSAYTTHAAEHYAPERIRQVLGEYLTLIPRNKIDYSSVAYAYLNLEEYDKALDAINNDIVLDSYHQQTRHYALLADIYRKRGDYKLALDAFETYLKIRDDKIYSVYTSETKFIEERHALEMQKAKETTVKNKIIFVGILFGVVFIATIVWLSSRFKIKSMEKLVADKEIERYKLLYQQVEEERDNLSELLSKNNEWDVNTRNAVAKRLELLNKFFTAYITHNIDIDRKANKEIEELLANKDTFMESTRLAFATSHPSFIKYLEEKGLTEWEISYCCLYALGLKGKEVGVYMKMSSHYNNSSCIREKLGLSETDTNLGIYIKKLLRSF